jgi:aspartate/tyrosine/aromatic aminotransferase
MKQYYEVYENAKIFYKGKKVDGNNKILTTKNREKALSLYRERIGVRWVEEITNNGSGEMTDIITPEL